MANDLVRQRPAVHMDDLTVGLDAIEEVFGVRPRVSSVERLPAAAQRQLVSLARKSLDADGEKELRELVEEAAPGLLKRAREAKEAREARVRAFRESAQGKPKTLRLPEGAAALPAGVLDDVLAGELLPADLALFSLVALTLSTGRVSEYAAGAGNARFDEDGALVVRNRGIVEDLDAGATSQAERVLGLRFDGTLKRLDRREWLEVERSGGGEVRLRPGRRLQEGGGT